VAREAGVRRRFAPHQLRHAHAVEIAREGVPLIVIQRQLGHTNLAITSIYLEGIDSTEIIDTVHARRAPMVPSTARWKSEPNATGGGKPRDVLAAGPRPTQQRTGAPSGAPGLLLAKKQESPPALLVVVRTGRLGFGYGDARNHARKAGVAAVNYCRAGNRSPASRCRRRHEELPVDARLERARERAASVRDPARRARPHRPPDLLHEYFLRLASRSRAPARSSACKGRVNRAGLRLGTSARRAERR
jgi:hypothetical protein